MADLKIIDSSVTTLQQGFKEIRSQLDLVGNDDMTPTRENVGYQRVIDAVGKFNQQISDTKNKYKKKTENFIDFLENVKSGAEDADQKIADALKVDSKSAGQSASGNSH